MAAAEPADSGGSSWPRRDKLLVIQEEAQSAWEKEGVFNVDAPTGEHERTRARKFFGTFPYPYMNGMLHLGHAFSLSKLEFACAFRRLRGETVLMPFGFHCTGMPIKACADKLKREMALYGNPPVHSEKAEADAHLDGDTSVKAGIAVPGAEQWRIMQQSGFSNDEIPQFADPQHWLEYFPPRGMRDVKALGCGIDWRRSFITTDANPYYDSFVRWQLNTLKRLGKVIKDKRLSIYSPLDGQVCADHDRSTGEGVGPQEYTLVKMRVLDESLQKGKLAELQDHEPSRRIYLGPATLRPETMYGQTNCFVLPSGEYGAYIDSAGDVLIISERAARNLSYQEQLAGQPGEFSSLMSISGSDLIGARLRGPNALRDRLPVLPMATIAMNKGTGVVTSVPSDAPDDYAAINDLKKRENVRKEYAISDELVKDIEPVEIIHVPEFGNACAVTACEERKVKSLKDRESIEDAKHRVYLKGFNEGTMLVGNHKGRKVFEAKAAIKQELVQSGEALLYNEPEKPVISRSNDECVVALTDQWYITYGEDDWKVLAKECIAKMTLYHEDVRKSFEITLDWLKQWACSRNFGLGTRLPFDPEYLIESLSDSTIYMAYYTVAHILQPGDLYGRGRDNAVPSEKMTDDVWDAVFYGTKCPDHFPKDVLQKMRDEFNFWYPLDLRASGRDLVQNHLTFCVYNHTALFDRKHWPRSFRCNGHVMLNNEKMSKSTGNFLTIRGGVSMYSADAMRFALADAGDGLDDANFEESNANAAILRLTKELSWMEEMLSPKADLRDDDGTYFADRAFVNEINFAAHSAYAAYDRFMFREALKAGFFDLMSSRDTYRQETANVKMNRDHVIRFIDVATRLLAPICPHFAEHVWRNLLKRSGTVTQAGWPEVPAPDKALRRAARYLDDLKASLRKTVQKAEQTKQKKEGKKKAVGVRMYVVEEFVGWQRAVLNILAESYDEPNDSFPDQSELVEKVKNSEHFSGSSNIKQVMKQVMPFMRFKMEEASTIGASALDVRLPFDEAAVLRENAPSIARNIGSSFVEVEYATGAVAQRAPQHVKVSQAVPGSPAVHVIFEGEEAATSNEKTASTVEGNEAPPSANGDAAGYSSSTNSAKAGVLHMGNQDKEKNQKKQQRKQQTSKGKGSDAASVPEKTPEPVAIVAKGSVADDVLKTLEGITGIKAQVEHGTHAAVRLGSQEYAGLNALVRTLTQPSMPHSAVGFDSNGERVLQADELLDTVLQEVLPGIEAGNVPEIKRGMAVVERTCTHNASQRNDNINAADIVFAACARRAEMLVGATGAKPALPPQCARVLKRFRHFLP